MNKHLIFLFTLIISLSAQASEEWLMRSIKILEKAGKTNTEEFLATPSEEQLEIAHTITEDTRKAVLADINKEKEPPSEIPNTGALLFASFSMPLSEIRYMFENEANQPGVQVVFRGMQEGKNLSGTYKTIKELTRGITPPPNVIIDPTLFTKFNITVAPTMLAFIDGEHTASARGIVSTQWIFKQIENDKKGDLGKHGSTYIVAENDLIEEMKSRMAQKDFESIQKQAIDTYWEKYAFTHLTPATKSAIFELDPTIHVKEDIKTPDGQFIAKAGQSINPLEKIPFTKMLIIFNPTRKNEITFVHELNDAAVKEGRGLVLIATEVDRIKGWDSLNETQAQFDFPVYLLNEQLQQRFGLRHTPTTVHADKLRFIITETYINNL